jgi:hypothetical protein
MTNINSKYRSFGETNLKYGILSETKKKKVTANFQQNFFSRLILTVGRVRGNKLIFNFGLRFLSWCKIK